LSDRVIGITGAAGFIGARLVDHFAGRGWRVRAMQRSPDRPSDSRVTRCAFEMPGPADPALVEGLDVLIHAAVQAWSPRRPDADRTNLDGTRSLIEAARPRGVHLIFLSTLSAHDRAESHYGRNKLEVERLFDPTRDCLLRLGLVLERRGGLFGGMVEALRSSAVVPLVDGGRQPIQTLAMDDLLAIVERVAERRVAGRFEVATPRVHRMRDLYEAILKDAPRRPLLVSVPLGLVSLGASMLEATRLPTPVTRENVLGLKALRAFDTAPSLAALGVELEPMEASVRRLLG
jgi:nucleoside-diphosphate-sugar epimerase